MYICALTIHSSKFVSSSGVFEHGCEKSQWHDDITQWRNVTSMEGNESLWHFLLRVTRLRIFCLAARPRRISRWCLRFIDSNRLLTETERERRSKGEKKKKITWPVTRIVNHALYFPAYNGRYQKSKYIVGLYHYECHEIISPDIFCIHFGIHIFLS